MQGVELTYARYMYYKENGLEILYSNEILGKVVYIIPKFGKINCSCKFTFMENILCQP